MLNRKWRTVSIDEMKRMPIDRLETVIASVPFDKDEVGKIWEKERGAFEVF